MEEEEKSFDRDDKKHFDDSLNNSNTSSQYSTRVIEFDENENQIVGNKKMKSSLEMVDLRPKANQEFREFKPAGTVNQNKKKKEKLKAKKIRDRELKALEEQKSREKAMEAARKKA